ncbi:hypothetical protein ACFLU6_07225 [Acidobacteriota bacterium]
MTTTTKTLRLRQDLRAEIETIARRSRRSFSDVAQTLLEEALKMRKCPGIYFADEPAGRDAKIAGTGLAIWEVIAVYRAVSKDQRRLRKRFHWLSEAHIKAALLYYDAYPEEIEELVAENEELSKEIPPAESSTGNPKS